jgi:hypothetical protein
MWLKRYTHYLLQHRWVTLAITFLITFVPIVGSFGSLIATLVTVRKGVVEGAVLMLAATIPYGLSFYFTASHEVNVVPAIAWVALSVTVLINVLAWVFAVMLRRHNSWSTLIQLGALFGVLVVSVVHLAFPDIAAWWMQQLTQQAALITGKLKNASGGMLDQQAQADAIKLSSEHMTGVIVAVVLFLAMTQLVVARWWQMLVFQTTSLRKELHHIRLSHLAGVLFLISLALAYYGNGNRVVLDIMPILYLLFSTAGLSVVHFIFGLMRSPVVWIWMLLIYTILVFTVPASIFFLSVLGLIDIWLDIRKRLKTG